MSALSTEDLAFRKTGLGGSDAAAAMGISPWTSPYDLWVEKTDPASPPLLDNPFMYWGTLLEPLLIEEYSRRTGFEIEPMRGIRSNKYPWMLANLDGRVKGKPRLLEIKTTTFAAGWGEPGTDEIPLYYAAQVHHYLTITEFEVADVAVLIGGSDFRLYRVERDKAIADAIVDEERAFWELVEKREPPPAITLADAVTRWGRSMAQGAVVAGDTEIEAIATLRLVADKLAEFGALQDQAQAVVLKAMADRGDGLVGSDGKLLATWKLDNGRKGYEVKPREPARRFLLKGT